MIQILLPNNVIDRIIKALRIAGSKEIGGILMGEHVGVNSFRIVDITIQEQAGTLSSFIRAFAGIAITLKRFFHRTNFEYTRYNYLGEWHSHPSFSLRPSVTDVDTMNKIVGDISVGANFVVLLIVQLSKYQLEAASYIFYPDGSYEKAETVMAKKVI